MYTYDAGDARKVRMQRTQENYVTVAADASDAMK